ncbi:glycosyltransferase [Microbacterium dauci]|uniref:Glycosyltransferase n=1 Tax=Microbacterium dauci TaxID=3048008 RepID=A0ABT6ZE70_9MICO|nr:glycosyltransferase [Microbacterium sp. LX3-4]MDJ1114455.1 glycosyltransferase [Microbacterium sp. LX3-4]
MRAVAVLAVLPDYRRNFVVELQKSFADSDDELVLVVGDAHLDRTVKSASFPGVVQVRNRALLGRRILWQVGVMKHVRGTDVAVVDLNPRSLTAWAILLRRKLARQRTLVWGHIHPRRGAAAATAPLRRLMRRLADGVISYTWSDGRRVRTEDRSADVWVAANGLYPSSLLDYSPTSSRTRFLCVGRIEPAKRPFLALQAFALALKSGRLAADTRLTFVGEGSQHAELAIRVQDAGLSDRVDLLGHVSDFARLRDLYSESIASLSPGYVGLSLTQSLGFGVAMLIADDEPHAPEIELATDRTSRMFRAGDAESFATAMTEAAADPEQWDRESIVQAVRDTYSSSVMAEGFRLALDGTRQEAR